MLVAVLVFDDEGAMLNVSANILDGPGRREAACLF
jgi:hypothetical protein